MKTIAEIYAALGGIEGGTEYVGALQSEITRLRNEAGTHRNQKNKVLQTLGINLAEGAGEDGLDSALAAITTSLSALKQNGGSAETIGRQIATLSEQVKSMTEKLTASEQKAQAEKDKRIGATKQSKVLAALQAGNATSPEVLAKVVLDNIVAKDDDTIVYKSGDKEIAVEEGVNAWLVANPWAVKNQQNAGGGSGGSGGTGGGTDLEKLSTEEYIKTREKK